MNSNTETATFSRTVADLPGPKGVPIFGNQLQMRGAQWHVTLASHIRKFGPIFRLEAFGIPIVVVSDRTAVSNLLRDRPEGFERSGGLRTRMNELKVGGVFTAEGEDWRKQRKMVTGGLSVDVIRNFFPTMGFMTERMLNRWKAALANGKPIDLRRDLKALALDIIVGISMGYDLDVVNDDSNPLRDAPQSMHMTWFGVTNWHYQIGNVGILLDGETISAGTTPNPASVTQAYNSLKRNGSVDVILVGHDHPDHTIQLPE